MHRHKLVRIGIGVSAIAVWLSQATVPAAAWSAIAAATGSPSQYWGYSYAYRSKADAIQRALAECRKRQEGLACDITALWDGSGCAAVGKFEMTSTLPDGRTGIVLKFTRGLGTTPRDATAAMHKDCDATAERLPKTGTPSCTRLVVVCGKRGEVKD
jgi:Domain of unknown function (DUF4189)